MQADSLAKLAARKVLMMALAEEVGAANVTDASVNLCRVSVGKRPKKETNVAVFACYTSFKFCVCVCVCVCE